MRIEKKKHPIFLLILIFLLSLCAVNIVCAEWSMPTPKVPDTPTPLPTSAATPTAAEGINETSSTGNISEPATETAVTSDHAPTPTPPGEGGREKNGRVPAWVWGIAVGLALVGCIYFLMKRKKEKASSYSDIANSTLLLTGKNSDAEKHTNSLYSYSFMIDQGARQYQEDIGNVDILENNPESIFGVIADGMGGMENGAESSQCALMTMFGARNENFQKLNTLSEKKIPDALKSLAKFANESVYALNGHKIRGGSTLAAVYIRRNKMYWVSVGDSRIFLLRDGELSSINEEHELESSMYQRLLDGALNIDDVDGVIESELRKLTSNLGRETIPLIDRNLRPYPLKGEDVILICSDGVSGSLSDPEIRSCLESGFGVAEECCKNIMKSVKENNIRGQDNYSAIVIACRKNNG